MLLLLAFVPPLVIGLVVGIRHGSGEGIAATICSLIINGILLVAVTHD